MSRKGSTVDERFLIKLYETAMQRGNWDSDVDLLAIGKGIGLREKSLKTILQLLSQANFVKKTSETQGRLTQNGKNLVLQLIGKGT